MNKLVLAAVATAVLLSGCTTTGTGTDVSIVEGNTRLEQAVSVCEIGLRAVHTVGGVANVLVLNGIAVEKAHQIAEQAYNTENPVRFACQTLVSLNALANAVK